MKYKYADWGEDGGGGRYGFSTGGYQGSGTFIETNGCNHLTVIARPFH